jgi:hypothetical protein
LPPRDHFIQTKNPIYIGDSKIVKLLDFESIRRLIHRLSLSDKISA